MENSPGLCILSLIKYVVMLISLNIIALSITDGLPGQQRVYLTPTGREKVKRYLQRRHREYLQSEFPDSKKRQFYTNTWAVVVDPPSKDVADTIAKRHGFINIGKIGNLDGYYHFKHVETSSKIEKRDHIKTGLLINEKEVLKATQQKVLERFKRDGYPTDPEFKKMWYLHNNGQGHSPGGVDLKVSNVWKQGYTGKDIVISVLDDGLDHTHPDLQPNYDEKASCDLNDNDDDPMPRDTDPDNCHGTRCAGEAVAAANNSICGVGVAYNAKVGGVRMLDGQATDALEAAALGFKNDHIDIYINCWGPKDDGKTFGKPGPIATNALKKAAIEGRKKKGNIFVWATGNGGLTDDDCNCDGYTTSIYTISIGCIGDHGTSAYYTEKCSSTLAVTFNGASHREGRENPMVTTDLYHGCTEEFKGTSASAPLAAGVIALVLEANKDLNWRQVQDAIIRSAQITSPVDEGWKRNGADFHYNLKFGFGRLDAEELVKVAKTMKPNSMGKHVKCITSKNTEKCNIPSKSGSIHYKTQVSECLEGEDDGDIPRQMPKRLEHVLLTISFVHKRRGDVSIKLFSPSGTESEMLSTRKYDDSTEGLDEWNFMTVFNWGEEDHQKGDWHIVVANNPDDDVEAASFASDSNNDVESLEEDVIDAQMKSKHTEWDHRREKDPFFSLPYPKGVRRSDIPNIERTKDENMIENKKDYRNDILQEIDDLISRKSTIPRPLGETVSRLLEVNEFNKIKEVPTEKDSRARIPHRHNKKTSHLFKKVQVQEEETGEPRVQINAGYEKAPIDCQNGEDCSGVVLGWKLTFFGGVPE